MVRRFLVTALCAAMVACFAPGCLERVELSGVGFRCDDTHRCREGLICAAGLCAAAVDVDGGTDAGVGGAGLPLRVAFYTVTYPFNWRLGADAGQGATHFAPTRGYYSTRTVLAQHLEDFAHAGLDALFVVWWGIGTSSDSDFFSVLRDAAAAPQKWAIAYQKDWEDRPDANAVKAMLEAIHAKYADEPNYLRLDGRPVVVVDNNPRDLDCSLSERYVRGNQLAGDKIYLVLRISDAMNPPGHRSCPYQPDAWIDHDGGARTLARGDSFAVSPGYWKWGVATPVLERNSAAFRTAVEAMNASGAKFQLVTSFNDWADGTAVESAEEWTSSSGRGVYLDALHDLPRP